MEEKKRKGYEFSLLVVLALLILIFFRFKPEDAGLLWLLKGMLAITLLSLLKPEWLAPLFGGVMYLTRAIGWVTNKVLLSIVFFGILAPLGLLRRLITRSNKENTSTWISRNKKFQPEDLTKSF